MLIIGCDFHTRFQQIAMAEDSTGERRSPCVLSQFSRIGGRPLAAGYGLGAAPFGFKGAVFDFASFLLVSPPRKLLNPPLQPFNRQFLPFSAKHLTS
jgi:hypothetical protein